MRSGAGAGIVDRRGQVGGAGPLGLVCGQANVVVGWLVVGIEAAGAAVAQQSAGIARSRVNAATSAGAHGQSAWSLSRVRRPWRTILPAVCSSR